MPTSSDRLGLFNALIVRTKKKNVSRISDSFFSLENSVILVSRQHKFIGTRVFGSLPKMFRTTKYMRLLSLCVGSVS